MLHAISHFLVDIFSLKPYKIVITMGIFGGYREILNTYIQDTLQIFKMILDYIYRKWHIPILETFIVAINSA